jgi:DNA-binding NtrC family response regulator
MREVNETLVGTSGALRRLLDDAAAVAPCDTTVLLTGESGTGKELLARFIHRQSRRCNESYVTCDCATLSPSLIESELFGFRRGAFTGALRDSPGYLASSHGGTLFLDEVGELDLRAQARLLRFLEEHTVVPVGEVKPCRVDVRVIAATNRDLERLTRAREFREDLFYRLNVVNLHVRALRERPEDVRALAEHFRASFAIAHGKTVVGFTPQAAAAFAAWRWPGNVRELRNAVERAVLLCRGTWIDREDVPPAIVSETGLRAAFEEARPEGSFAGSTERFQRRLLFSVLRETKGNREEAALRLSLTVHQIKYLVKKLGSVPE